MNQKHRAVTSSSGYSYARVAQKRNAFEGCHECAPEFYRDTQYVHGLTARLGTLNLACCGVSSSCLKLIHRSSLTANVSQLTSSAKNPGQLII